MASAPHDPITLQVIHASLQAAATEMFAVLRRTAMSPIIYEVLDAGTAITTARGELVCSGAGIPTFVGALDKAVAHLASSHADTTLPGDVFITNDPSYGGVTHLNDVVIAEPIHIDGVVIAWAASVAHWSDIGGLTAGSMAVDAREIFQEGLRLPAVKLIDAGTPIQGVFDIVRANSRQPDTTLGDLWAQIAAGRRAAKRITAVAKAYGLDAWQMALDAAFDADESRARTGLATLPQGRYSLSAVQDDQSTWTVHVHIKSDRFTVDLRDGPDQIDSPYNTSRDSATIAAQMLFKALCDPTRHASAGSFRPLEILTRPGSLFDPTETAPHGFYFETRIRLLDLLWQCLAPALPNALPAGHFGTIGATVIAGKHPDTGRRSTLVEPQMGGWGATHERDGQSALFSTNHGDTFNCPAEITEARHGIDVRWRQLSAKACGPGLHHGGRGLDTCYAARAPVTVAVGFSRNREPVWGTQGGGAGDCNTVTLTRTSGDTEQVAFASGLELNAGDSIRVETASGGGWGKPAD